MTVLSVSVFGPESVSYERSRSIFRTNLRHFSARVFFVKIPQSQDSMIYTIFMFFRMHIPQMDSSPMLFSHPTRPSARPDTQSISSDTQHISSDTQNISSDTQDLSFQTQKLLVGIVFKSQMTSIFF